MLEWRYRRAKQKRVAVVCDISRCARPCQLVASLLAGVSSFSPLLFDGVVGGHDKDDDIGDVGSPAAHVGEGGVAGGVDEGDLVVVVGNLVRGDVLGNAPRLAGRDRSRADEVQEGSLSVVDMPHDGDDGGASEEGVRVVLVESEAGLVGGLVVVVLVVVILRREGNAQGVSRALPWPRL